MRKLTVKSKAWLYPGMAAWHFASVLKKASAEIKKVFGELAAGFGSLPVVATVGETSWKTSIFPDAEKGEYLVPLKAEVRKRENITVGKAITLTLEIKV